MIFSSVSFTEKAAVCIYMYVLNIYVYNVLYINDEEEKSVSFSLEWMPNGTKPL